MISIANNWMNSQLENVLLQRKIYIHQELTINQVSVLMAASMTLHF